MSDQLVPNYDIEVGGVALDAGVRALIDVVMYESADGVADVAKISAKNPDFVLSDSRIFMPGNEMSIWMGYGQELRHIGRVKIYKARPNFPAEDAMPTIDIIGYTRDHDMMHRSPPQSPPRGATSRGRRSGSRRRQAPSGRRFRDMKYSEAVEQRAREYSFSLDVDETPEAPTNFIQRAGMSDYDFVNGLANLSGFVFWVDGDERGNWTLHFRDPEGLQLQDRVLTFERDLGDDSTLFSFEPEFLVTESIAEVRVRFQDPRTGRVMEAEFTEDNLETPEVLLEVDAALETQEVDSPLTTAAAVQLYIGDYSFQEVTTRRFASEADLTRWARQWYRRQRENFILSAGTCIGVEDVMARQVHNIRGAGRTYSGQYYFSRVAHRQDTQSGYVLEFDCRKQTPRMQQ